jgi:acyl-CoA thioester hydrolase
MDAFEIEIAIHAEDIDQMGHVNNTVYLRWVQDAAVAHWRTLADSAEQETTVWVVTRHEIDYKHPAFLEDKVIARTWVGAAAGLRFDRHTELLRAADRRLLARARTIWCPINPKTGRPTDVSPAIRARFSIPS